MARKIKPTKKILNSLGIHNPHNVAAEGGAKLFIYYRCQETGRAYQSAAWQVCGIGFKTGPKGDSWRDGGDKTFSIWDVRQQKASKLEEAKAWAKKRVGIKSWERDVFGAWHPKGTLQNIVDQISKKQR